MRQQEEWKDTYAKLRLQLEFVNTPVINEAVKFIRFEMERKQVSSFVKVIGQPATMLRKGEPIGPAYTVQTNIYQLRRYNQMLSEYIAKIRTLYHESLSKLQEEMKKLDKAISEFDFAEGETVKDIEQVELDELREIERQNNTTITTKNIGSMSPEAWKAWGEHIL